jgi:hypothetical protein
MEKSVPDLGLSFDVRIMLEKSHKFNNFLYLMLFVNESDVAVGSWETKTGMLAGAPTLRADRRCSVKPSAIFTEVELAATTDCGYCMPYENDQPVWICRGLKIDWLDLHSRVRHFG